MPDDIRPYCRIEIRNRSTPLRAEVLRRENEELRQFVPEVHEARDLPFEEVRVLVREYALGVPKGVPIFASDVAYDLCLDPDAVEEAMEDLCREGFLS